MKKYEYINLEEGMIILGYSIPREKALALMNRKSNKEWGDPLTESEYDLVPIYELTRVYKDDEEAFSWKNEPDSPYQRIIGWAFLC